MVGMGLAALGPEKYTGQTALGTKMYPGQAAPWAQTGAQVWIYPSNSSTGYDNYERNNSLESSI